MSRLHFPVPTATEVATLGQRCRFARGVTGALIADLGGFERRSVRDALATFQADVLDGEPGLPLSTREWPGPPTPLFYGVAITSLVPHAEARYAERGVPDEVVADTLWDIGQQIDVFRRIHGRWGLDEQGWLTHHVHGRIVKLGRLQFCWETHWWDPPADLSVTLGDAALGVHIPEQGPFPPEACDDSFERAITFFADHYPDVDWKAFTCLSWLLDEQLGDHLPRTSNIVDFQRRFVPAPEMRFPSNDSVVKFVFRRVGVDPGDLPRDTTLQRVVIDHLRGGGTWHTQAGTFVP